MRLEFHVEGQVLDHAIERRLRRGSLLFELRGLLVQRVQAIFLIVELLGVALQQSFFFGTALAALCLAKLAALARSGRGHGFLAVRDFCRRHRGEVAFASVA